MASEIRGVDNFDSANVGKVLQVVSLLSTTQGSQTITSTDSQIGLLSKTITPKGASSKFLVVARWFGEISAAWDTVINVQMDGTRVNDGGAGGMYGLSMPVVSYGHVNNDDTTPEMINFSTLVSTSSVIGTDIVFKIVAQAQPPANRTLWNNRCFNTSHERGTSEIIITEIGA